MYTYLDSEHSNAPNQPIPYTFLLFSPDDAQNADYLDNLCMSFQSMLRVKDPLYQAVVLLHCRLDSHTRRIIVYNIGKAYIETAYPTEPKKWHNTIAKCITDNHNGENVICKKVIAPPDYALYLNEQYTLGQLRQSMESAVHNQTGWEHATVVIEEHDPQEYSSLKIRVTRNVRD